MNKRIIKVREDIRLTEKKIREMNEYLKTLKAKEKQLCDDEILKTMREMAGKGGDVMELLKQLQDGGEVKDEPVKMDLPAEPQPYEEAEDSDNKEVEPDED